MNLIFLIIGGVTGFTLGHALERRRDEGVELGGGGGAALMMDDYFQVDPDFDPESQEW